MEMLGLIFFIRSNINGPKLEMLSCWYVLSLLLLHLRCRFFHLCVFFLGKTSVSFPFNNKHFHRWIQNDYLPCLIITLFLTLYFFFWLFLQKRVVCFGFLYSFLHVFFNLPLFLLLFKHPSNLTCNQNLLSMSLCICKKQFFLFLIVLMLLIRGAVYSISVVFSDPDVASDSLAARSWYGMFINSVIRSSLYS